MGVTSNPKRKSYSALLPLGLLSKETMRGERQSLVVMASEGWILGVRMQLAPERLDALLSLLCLESRKRSDMRTDPPTHTTVIRSKGKSAELGRGKGKG